MEVRCGRRCGPYYTDRGADNGLPYVIGGMRHLLFAPYSVGYNYPRLSNIPYSKCWKRTGSLIFENYGVFFTQSRTRGIRILTYDTGLLSLRRITRFKSVIIVNREEISETSACGAGF